MALLPTGCFTMNEKAVYAYFSAYEASSDLKDVAKCYGSWDIFATNRLKVIAKSEIHKAS